MAELDMRGLLNLLTVLQNRLAQLAQDKRSRAWLNAINNGPYAMSLRHAWVVWRDSISAETHVVEIPMEYILDGGSFPATYRVPVLSDMTKAKPWPPSFPEYEDVQLHDYDSRFMGYGPRTNTLVVALPPGCRP